MTLFVLRIPCKISWEARGGRNISWKQTLWLSGINKKATANCTKPHNKQNIVRSRAFQRSWHWRELVVLMIADIFWLDLFTSEYKTPGLALSSYTTPYPGIGNGFRVLWPGWQRHQLQEADLNLSWLFSSWELGCFMPGKQLVHSQLKFCNLNRKNKEALELAVGPRVALELLAWEWLLRRDWRVRCLLLSPTHPHTTYPLHNSHYITLQSIPTVHSSGAVYVVIFSHPPHCCTLYLCYLGGETQKYKKQCSCTSSSSPSSPRWTNTYSHPLHFTRFYTVKQCNIHIPT